METRSFCRCLFRVFSQWWKMFWLNICSCGQQFSYSIAAVSSMSFHTFQQYCTHFLFQKLKYVSIEEQILHFWRGKVSLVRISLAFYGAKWYSVILRGGEDKENNGDDRKSMFGRSLHHWHRANCKNIYLWLRRKGKTVKCFCLCDFFLMFPLNTT